MKQQMNGQNVQILSFPAIKSEDKPTEEKQSPERGWFFRRMRDLGVIEMADSQPKPPGFFINATTILSFLMIALIIIGLYIFTYIQASNAAYEKGVSDTEKKVMLERLAKAEEDARKAKEWQIFQGQNTNTQKENNK